MTVQTRPALFTVIGNLSSVTCLKKGLAFYAKVYIVYGFVGG